MPMNPDVGLGATATHQSEEYARLTAEGEELVRQRGALEHDPDSEVYQQYVARLHAHLTALAAYMDTLPPA